MAAVTQFTHRLTIDSDSAILKAAYDIAKKAHWDSGQGRGKVWPGTEEEMPYLVHPIMLYDLMQHFGEKDEITLACALLHDAKEDFKGYIDDPELFRKDLAERLQHYGIVDHEEIAYYIDEICDELTNDHMMAEGKRTWQIEHAGKISMRSARIKIFDQMASVLDNIICPDILPPGKEDKGNRWSRSWSYKALDLVKSIATERPQLEFLRCMFKVLFKTNIDLMEPDAQHDADPSDTTAAALRAAFDFDKAEAEAYEIMNNPAPYMPPFTTLDHKRAQQIENGIPQVKLSKEGLVTHYAILANPMGDQRELRNETAIQLLGALEESELKRRVSVGPREVLDGRLVRMNHIKPEIPVEQFIALAKDVQALEKSFSIAILDKSRALASGRGV